MLVIEHSLDVIKTADWVIDLGPEGGSGGGMVVAEGSPEDIARTEGSHTGRFLRPLLGHRREERMTTRCRVLLQPRSLWRGPMVLLHSHDREPAVMRCVNVNTTQRRRKFIFS